MDTTTKTTMYCFACDANDTQPHSRCASCGDCAPQAATWVDGREAVCQRCVLPELEPNDVPMPLERMRCPCCLENYPAWALVQVLQGDYWCCVCALTVSNALMLREPVRTLGAR